MATFVRSNPGSPSTTVRHSWRIESFSEYGDDPLIKAHRQTVTYDSATGAVLSTDRGGTVQRRLSELPTGPRNQLAALYALTDQWEEEDKAKKKND